MRLRGQVVFYEGLPVNIGVPVFQHGVAEGLRLFLGRADLAADRVQSFDSIPPPSMRTGPVSFDTTGRRSRTGRSRNGRDGPR
jgi:hypothetical protein